MITEKELQISNMSYTEKDFQSIYPALLTLAKQLTNRWDPASSNESDPGNVLLKLAAVVGDKTNYNIDKNVLECFMPSATQETSMRMLTEALGYNMKYYQSATVDLLFKYTDDLKGQTITLPKLTTVIANEDKTIYYTLVDDVKIALSNYSITARAIEGSLSTLLVGNNEVIKMENLDDNHRLYFPESMVAQNGIFITNYGVAPNFEQWKLVDNLNVQSPLTTCYKFGFDSVRGLPYVEFPSDMAELIGAGILVSYIVTKGANGGVSMGALTTLTGYPDGTFDNLSEDNLVIYNASASTAGADKETIDEAYTSFKKIIGTFDTLVTTRDYANAIYNLTDAYGNPLVSNASVADRVDDFNYGLNVVSYDKEGQYIDFVPNDNVTVSDLTLYPLQPYQGQNYNVYNPSYVYNESFKPLKFEVTNTSDQTPPGESSTIYTDSEDVVTDLDDLRCIAHSFRDMWGDEVCLFKTVASLDVQIFTYAKVNVIEQAEIKNNVLRALSNSFNARELDYGYEIPYDSILDVIYAADSRIKSVSLAEPLYEVQAVTPDTPEGEPVTVVTDVLAKVAAKNVLAGKLELFQYDDRFEWSFGQVNIDTYDRVQSISTSLAIALNNSDTTAPQLNYTLDKNEVLQFIAPSVSTQLIYPAGVYYQFLPNLPEGVTELSVAANTNYVLKQGEQFNIYYTDSAGNLQEAQYTQGQIIRPSFEMYSTNPGGKTTEGAFVMIGKDNQIEMRNKVEVKLTQDGTPIYWVRNNANNVLFPGAPSGTTINAENPFVQEVLLDSGEYFIYSNPTLDDIVVLGAGTRLTRFATTPQMAQSWQIKDPLSLETINLNGLSAFTQGDWEFKQFSQNNYLKIEQMRVATFGEGTTIEVDGTVYETGSTPATWVEGNFKGMDPDAVITYTYNGETKTLENAVSGSWLVRTRLDVVCGPEAPQTLRSHTDSSAVAGEDKKEQSIEIKYLSTTNRQEIFTLEGSEEGKQLLFSLPADLAGGNDISMLVTNLLTGASAYTVSAATYDSQPVYTQMLDDNGDPVLDDNNAPVQTALDPSTTINVSLDQKQEIVLPINIEKFETAEPDQLELAVGLSSNYEYKPYATYIIPLLAVLDSGASTSTQLTLSSSPAGVFNLYKYNSDSYTALSTEPADWDTNWTHYFTHDSLYGYEAVESVWNESDSEWEAPDWDSTWEKADGTPRYYSYDGPAPLTSITTSGLYNLEVVAGWLGVYDSYDDLVAERDTGNTDGDICRVIVKEDGVVTSDTLYEWDDSQSGWIQIEDSSPSDYQIRILVAPGDDVTTAEVLTIGHIHKVDGLNSCIAAAVDEGDVLHAIDDLTAGAKNSDGADVTFYYTFTPDNSRVIETDNMSTAEAFWDVNNIVNKFTISQLDLENSSIAIARSSQA